MATAASGEPRRTLRRPGAGRPLFADFHSLRHCYVSMLARAGLTVKQAQKLARHSSPELTIGRYAHAELQELGAAVGRLPALAAAPAEAFVNIPEAEYQALRMLAAVGLALWKTVAAAAGGKRNPGATRQVA